MKQLDCAHASFVARSAGGAPLQALAPVQTDSSHALCLYFFAGIQFLIEAPASLLQLIGEQGARLPLALPGLVNDAEVQRLTGDVWCELSIRHPLPRPSASSEDDAASRALSWTWLGGSCRVTTPSAWAELTWDGRARGRAALAPCAGALEALLSAVAAAILYRRGGAVLHAAGVEVEGGVVAFIGPSGAGKSTAARQSGAAPFCVDRLALLPPAEPTRGWSVCALPGGTVDPDAPASPCDERPPVRPLRGVLRVRQKPDVVAIEPVRGVRALGLLRAAVFQGPRVPELEGRLLESLESLSASVPMAELHFGLGAPLQRRIEGWLGEAR